MRYEKISLLGQGSTAAVWLCRDRYLGRFVAGKSVVSRNRQGIESLRREKAILENLDHPGIPQVLGYEESGKEAILYMTLRRGRSLEGLAARDVLRRDLQGVSRRLAWEALAASWGGQICQVLDYLHRSEPPLIYCDLKPANLILDREGFVWMVDFGSVRLSGDDPCGQNFGTRGYAAPEQYPEEAGSPRAESDIYALGRVMQILLGPDASASMQEIIRRCTERDPGLRFHSAAELGRRFHTIAVRCKGEVFLRENW